MRVGCYQVGSIIMDMVIYFVQQNVLHHPLTFSGE